MFLYFQLICCQFTFNSILSTLPNSIVPFNDGDLSYGLYWNVSDLGNTQVLNFMMVLNTTKTSFSWPWVSFGFGDSMLRAQFIVCHGNSERGPLPRPVMHEHVSTGVYGPPPHQYDTEKWALALDPIFVELTPTQFICFSSRKVIAPDPSRINLTSKMKMLWAFNPQSGINYKGERFTLHKVNHMGAFEANLVDGSSLKLEPVSQLSRQVHGFGMITAWMFVIPFGVFFARYAKSLNGWIIVKVVNQGASVIAVFAFSLIMLTQVSYYNLAHSVLGLTIICIMIIQICLGIAAFFGFFVDFINKKRVLVGNIHRFLGMALLIVAAVQVGLGINIYFPWVEPRQPIVWIVYIFLCTFWTFLFCIAELFWRFKVSNADLGYQPTATGPSKEYINSTDLEYSEKKKLTFTWESLGKEIEQGAMYVVADGRFVYDISQWINSHPGGQIILYSVCGTDITNDYFHEAGFDAQEFTPMQAFPSRTTHLEPANISDRNSSQLNVDIDAAKSLMSIECGMHDTAFFSEDDWKFIVKARRTHVHTKLAIKRLASLVIGEISPVINPRFSLLSDSATVGNLAFDRYEYRRYAITSIQQVSMGKRPSYRIRLCLLYPYSIREGSPKRLLPGQCIEIQARINGEYVSRYYSPINENLSALEILVKVQPNGKMSRYLVNQSLGDRQFKIRGPFGRPLVDPERPLVLGTRILCHETIFFIAGGSGITPFLQMINLGFLSINRKLVVICFNDWHTCLFCIENQMKWIFYKDIKYSQNTITWMAGRTQKEGIFPLACTVPLLGRRTKFVLLNCVDDANEIGGLEYLQAASLSYPRNIEIHHFISNPTTSDGLIPGNSHHGRLRPSDVYDLLTPRWNRNDRYAQKVIICGPDAFSSYFVDVMTEFGCSAEELTILPSTTFGLD